MTSGWLINIAIAEWIIRRPSIHRARRPAVSRPAQSA
jgi:hypothetical protein